ncbi:MAG: hypothetical protein WCO30_00725 [bacterium]
MRTNKIARYGFGKVVDDLLHDFYTTNDQKKAEGILRRVSAHLTSFEQANRISSVRNLPNWKATLVSNMISDFLMQSDRLPTTRVA